jgi:hypothetical protein
MTRTYGRGPNPGSKEPRTSQRGCSEVRLFRRPVPFYLGFFNSLETTIRCHFIAIWADRRVIALLPELQI